MVPASVLTLSGAAASSGEMLQTGRVIGLVHTEHLRKRHAEAMACNALLLTDF